MKSAFKQLLTGIVLACVLTLSQSLAADTKHKHASHAAPATTSATTPDPEKVTAAREGLRDLWSAHIFWMRNVALAAVNKNDAQRKSSDAQVVANAKAIGAYIEPFYGKPAGDQLFELLKGHHGAIVAYLDATLAGDKAGAEKAQKDLNDNAVKIAEFLSSANPKLPKDALVGLLSAHGAHHIAQIQALSGKQYDQEAVTWAAMSKHMNTIADALVNGIAKQFPDKF